MNNTSWIQTRLLHDPFYISMNVCETSVGCSLANRDFCVCLSAVRSRTTRFCPEILTRQKGCRLWGWRTKMSMVLTWNQNWVYLLLTTGTFFLLVSNPLKFQQEYLTIPVSNYDTSIHPPWYVITLMGILWHRSLVKYARSVIQNSSETPSENKQSLLVKVETAVSTAA